MSLRPADWGTALPIASLLILAVAFAALGRWQLARAAENRALIENFGASLQQSESNPAALPETLGRARYTRVALRGRYVPDRHVLLDNMTHDGAAGFEVLTPFRLERGELILVNRGWFDAGPGRDRIPALAVADDSRTVLGWLDGLPQAAWHLANAMPAANAPYAVLSYPSSEELEAALGQPVAGFQLLLDASQADGFLRDWAPDDGLAQRNLAYAGQWFVFALMAAAGSGFVLYRRLKRSAATLRSSDEP